MSRAQNKEAENVDQQNEPVNEPAKDEKAFPVSELLENSQKLFGYYPEVLEAALVGKNKETLTVSEAKSHIKAFMKKEVK